LVHSSAAKSTEWGVSDKRGGGGGVSWRLSPIDLNPGAYAMRSRSAISARNKYFMWRLTRASLESWCEHLSSLAVQIPMCSQVRAPSWPGARPPYTLFAQARTTYNRRQLAVQVLALKYRRATKGVNGIACGAIRDKQYCAAVLSGPVARGTNVLRALR